MGELKGPSTIIVNICRCGITLYTICLVICPETGDVIGVHGMVNRCLFTSQNGSRSAFAAPYMPAASWLGPIFKDCQLNQASERYAPALISTSWLGGIAREKHWPVISPAC